MKRFFVIVLCTLVVASAVISVASFLRGQKDQLFFLSNLEALADGTEANGWVEYNCWDVLTYNLGVDTRFCDECVIRVNFRPSIPGNIKKCYLREQ